MSHRLLFPALAAAALAATSVPASAAATSYGFALGESTSFAVGDATFSSPDGAFSAADVSSLYSTVTGIALENFSASPATLVVTFAAPIAGYVSLNFGLDNILASGDTLTVTPNVGAAQVVASTLPGSDLFPQGTASFDATGATTLTITSADVFAIGDLSVGVPEPASMAALGAGLIGLLGARRRA